MSQHEIQEQWRPVVGSRGWYAVSDLGRVKRARDGKGTWAGRLLVVIHEAVGYVNVKFSIHGRITSQRVHRLVMAAFNGPCPAGEEVNHKNGVKDDNRLSNLEYVTHAYNSLHTSQVLGLKRGESHGMSKLKSAEVSAIKKLLRRGWLQRQIAKLYNVSQSSISFIKLGTTWAHVA